MAAKRLKKGESPLKKVGEIEAKIKAWRTKMQRAVNMLGKLEKQRTYYVQKSVEQGLS